MKDLPDLKEALEIMKKLAVDAGKEILKFYKKELEIEYKKDESPVTDADKAADGIIVRGLKERFPDMPVLSEESADDLSRQGERFCFIVDPLDGTREFIKENDEFTVNIALTEWGRPVAGVIYVPVYDELYYAARSLGAWSYINGLEKRITVSRRTKDIRLARSRSHYAPEMDRLIAVNDIRNVITAGSAYKGCLLARGDVEVYYRFGKTMEWDTAAMDIIVTEAGGIFSGMDGKAFVYNKQNPENPTGFYALNRKENALKTSME
ncbi:MAG TPA: 3'(2'),5'-bisphosphate nucleotidase CysQ [Clostridiaceae bacterium]|nr:3'(2'),5'-bisphosphate nucleotidase CysQ [Clostridiaceae bacterium]